MSWSFKFSTTSIIFTCHQFCSYVVVVVSVLRTVVNADACVPISTRFLISLLTTFVWYHMPQILVAQIICFRCSNSLKMPLLSCNYDWLCWLSYHSTYFYILFFLKVKTLLTIIFSYIYTASLFHTFYN